VNVDAVDVRLELIERVQALLLGSPVVLVTPVVDEALEVRQVRTVIPSGIRELVGETALSQPPFQIGQDTILNVNFEGDDGLIRRGRRFSGALCVCDPAGHKNGNHAHSGRSKSNASHAGHTVRTYAGEQAETATWLDCIVAIKILPDARLGENSKRNGDDV